jgi:hypothetical protein
MLCQRYQDPAALDQAGALDESSGHAQHRSATLLVDEAASASHVLNVISISNARIRLLTKGSETCPPCSNLYLLYARMQQMQSILLHEARS